VLSVFPSLTPPELKYRLIGTAAAKPGLVEKNASNGRLDAAAAVTLQDTSAPSAIGDLAVQTTGWNGAVLSFTAPGGNGSSGRAAFYQVRVTTGPLNSSNWYQLPSTPPYIRPQVTGTAEHILLNELASGGNYNAAVRAVDSAGNAAPISNVVTINTPLPTTILQDDCDTTHPVWTPNGFYLSAGYTHTGLLSWQDSPEDNYKPSAVATLTAGPFDLTALSRPRISFYLRRYFPMGQDRVDSLKVEGSSNGGSSWKELKRFHGSHAPMRRETVALDDVAGTGNTVIRLLTVADSNSVVSDGVYIDDIRIHEGAGGVADMRDVIIETIDFYANTALPPVYSNTGGWFNDTTLKSLAPLCEGFSSYRVAAGFAATGQFTPFIPFAGKYEVYSTWSSAESATGVTYRVRHTGGDSVRVVDQLASTGHRWTSLGTYTFNYGRSDTLGAVTVDASTASGQNVRSDAIRLRYAQHDATPLPNGTSDWQHFD
jgi:hypothetical protein